MFLIVNLVTIIEISLQYPETLRHCAMFHPSGVYEPPEVFHTPG